MDHFLKHKGLKKAKRDGSRNILIPMNIPSSQILVSKHHGPLKGTRLLREMPGASARAAKEQGKPGTCCARK